MNTMSRALRLAAFALSAMTAIPATAHEMAYHRQILALDNDSARPDLLMKKSDALLKKPKCQADVACACHVHGIRLAAAAQASDKEGVTTGLSSFMGGPRCIVAGHVPRKLLSRTVLERLFEMNQEEEARTLALYDFNSTLVRKPAQIPSLPAHTYLHLLKRDPGNHAPAAYYNGFLAEVAIPVGHVQVELKRRLSQLGTPATEADYQKIAQLAESATGFFEKARDVANHGKCKAYQEICNYYFDGLLDGLRESRKALLAAATEKKEEIERAEASAKRSSGIGSFLGALAGYAGVGGASAEVTQALNTGAQLYNELAVIDQQQAAALKSASDTISDSELARLTQALAAK